MFAHYRTAAALSVLVMVNCAMAAGAEESPFHCSAARLNTWDVKADMIGEALEENTSLWRGGDPSSPAFVQLTSCQHRLLELHAKALIVEGRYEEALKPAFEILEMDPSDSTGALLHAAATFLGQLEDAGDPELTIRGVPSSDVDEKFRKELVRGLFACRCPRDVNAEGAGR